MKKILLILTILYAAGCAPVKVTCMDKYMSVVIRGVNAEKLQFYSSDYAFKPISAERIDNKWEVKVMFSDSFRYFLNADGKFTLPDCEMKEKDDFGGEICLYEQVNRCDN